MEPQQPSGLPPDLESQLREFLLHAERERNRPPPPARLFKGQEVNLTWGAILTIAVIVAFCAGGGKTDLDPVSRRLDTLKQDVKRLEGKVEGLTRDLKATKPAEPVP